MRYHDDTDNMATAFIRAFVVGFVIVAVALSCGGCGGGPTTIEEEVGAPEVRDTVTIEFVEFRDGIAPDTIQGHGYWTNAPEDLGALQNPDAYLHHRLEYTDSTLAGEWLTISTGGAHSDHVGFGGTYTPGGPWFALRYTVWTDSRISGDTTYIGGVAQDEWERP